MKHAKFYPHIQTQPVQLRLLGYWHSWEAPDWPDPGWFVDTAWNPAIRQQVLNYLKHGQLASLYMGVSWCRFRCGKEMGSRELTDGTYVWPENLAHYVEHHHIRLPSEVCAHIQTNQRKELYEIQPLDIESSWWQAQKGFSRTIKTHQSLLDIGLVSIQQTEPLLKDQQKVLLKEFLFKGQDYTQKLRLVNSILEGNALTLKGKFTDYHAFAEKAHALGLQTTFRAMTYTEYTQP